ncbi:MAG: CHAT domain-containing protein [Deferribacteres bacterium]|nr:CHAT domain-containing protein [candidate division KSB1 bacterium]MCB9503124.1 CHAT domain-containing protein [Deferribacteres bacterium]
MKVSLIEFFVTADKTHIFVIDTQKSQSGPWCLTIEISEQEIHAAISLIWNFEKNPIVIQANTAHFQKVGAKLLRPVLDYLAPCDILYIVPHKDLHYLPFHAVEIDRIPLCEQTAVVYLPSASILQYCQVNNARRSNDSFSFNKILSLGVGIKNDTIENRRKFQQEAEYINNIFNSEKPYCLTGVKATKKNFNGYASGCDLIHIASHGYFDQQQPLNSGPVLAWGRQLANLDKAQIDNKFVLQANELSKLNLKVNLVVLNTCFSGMHEVQPGDELMGVVRALFVAGVPSMMLSLWEAHHDAAICFMKSFYTEIKAGTAKAIAYQKAQKHLREQPEFSEMKYWAPFILLGDWL